MVTVRQKYSLLQDFIDSSYYCGFREPKDKHTLATVILTVDQYILWFERNAPRDRALTILLKEGQAMADSARRLMPVDPVTDEEMQEIVETDIALSLRRADFRAEVTKEAR